MKFCQCIGHLELGGDEIVFAFAAIACWNSVHSVCSADDRDVDTC